MAKNRSGNRREQILDASLALFARYGIGGVTTRMIAECVGISQPSLYAHFANSHDIATELCCRAFGRLQERMEAAVYGEDDPRDKLLRLGREYVRFGLEEPAMYRVAFMIDQPDGDAQASPVLGAGLKAFGVLLVLFHEVLGTHGVSTDAMAQSTWASMHGLVALLLVRHEFPWADRDELVELHLRRLCEMAFETPDLQT